MSNLEKTALQLAETFFPHCTNGPDPKTEWAYKRILDALDSLAVESKPLDPEIKAVVQENFWELAGKAAVEPSEEARELVHKIRIGFAEMNYCPVLVLSDTDAADLITARDERIRREYERLNRNLVSAIKEAVEKIRIGDEETVDWSCARDAATRLKSALKWNDSDLAAIMGGKE